MLRVKLVDDNGNQEIFQGMVKIFELLGEEWTPAYLKQKQQEVQSGISTDYLKIFDQYEGKDRTVNISRLRIAY